jgi:glycosyltransferase involved in cell wall biosynthesis
MSDCLVVPSVAEGFGYNVLESVSTGVPLVTTNTTSIPEVICGKHLLVTPKNSKALADGICSVQKKQYKTTPQKTFTWASNIAAHEKLYKTLIKNEGNKKNKE